MKQHYPFPLEPLPYPYDGLEPELSKEILTFHHDKHLKTYVDNLNNLLAGYPNLQKLSLEDLLMQLDSLPKSLQTGIQNNGGGVYNHNLLAAMNRDIGS